MRKYLVKAATIVLLLFPLSISQSLAAQDVDEMPSEDPKYEIVDGKVDKGTFNGWRRFHSTCHVCHGQDALGTSFAPSLVESLQQLDYATFVTIVTEGRQVVNASGEAAAMPAFGEDPNVAKHIDDIYRYLSARARGGLQPGRPKK